MQRMPAVSRPAWMLALSGIAGRGGGPRRSPVEMLHRTVAAMREDFAALRFHTAIARIIELTAHASRLPRLPRALAEPLVLMVAPLAPHIAEELWQRLGHPSSLAREPFPQAQFGSGSQKYR